MLNTRLAGTGASISALGGYKQAGEPMNAFLNDPTEDTRSAIKRLPDQRVVLIERNILLAASPAEITALG